MKGRTMKEISLKIDEKLLQPLEKLASSRSCHLDQLIIEILRLVVEKIKQNENSAPQHHDLDHLFGSWSEEDFQEFMSALEEIRPS